MSTIPVIAAALIMMTFVASDQQHEGAPHLACTQNFITDVSAELCSQRAAEALVNNGLTVTEKGSEHCVGTSNDHNVVVFCDPCGASMSTVISVATNVSWSAAATLRDRILEHIATGSPAIRGMPPQIWLDKTEFAPGESIAVHFTALEGYPDNAWVGIVPSNIAHGDEATNDNYDITYQYLYKKTSGSLLFTAPTAGSWDFRMHDTDNGGKEVAYVSFVVR